MTKTLAVLCAIGAIACAIGVVKEPIQLDKIAAGFFCAILTCAAVAAWKAKGLT